MNFLFSSRAMELRMEIVLGSSEVGVKYLACVQMSFLGNGNIIIVNLMWSS